MHDIQSEPQYFPRRDLQSAIDLDAEASRVRKQLDWPLAAFVALFDDDLREVLLVQLGDYCRDRYLGNPWTLPGGAVDSAESPSEAICRELNEETGIVIDRTSLRPAGWFPRPYYKPHYRDQLGELLVLFAATASPIDPAIRPAPPETLAASFFPFSLAAFLAVPCRGSGQHPLQPLPKHFSYWAKVGQAALSNQLRPPLVCVYQNQEQLQIAPWPVKDAAHFQDA